MIRIILILFLLTTSVSADCKYYATADVENDTLVNKKETYVCKEDENFIIQFITDEKYHYVFTMVFFTLLEHL